MSEPPAPDHVPWTRRVVDAFRLLIFAIVVYFSAHTIVTLGDGVGTLLRLGFEATVRVLDRVHPVKHGLQPPDSTDAAASDSTGLQPASPLDQRP